MGISPEFQSRLKFLQDHTNENISLYLKDLSERIGSNRQLFETIAYSLKDGGSRIRPALTCLTAEVFGKNLSEVMPYGCAVEMIHTYSLIHDDLPSMDNDDVRRGRPSNHKAFGEALAILAGDSLNTEAFYWIARCYGDRPALAVALIIELSRASGIEGMAGGQSLDFVLRSQSPDLKGLEHLHAKKTGALIKASIIGAAQICDGDALEMKALSSFAEQLGVVYQIADDISDVGIQKDEPSYLNLMSLSEARLRCEALVAAADESLRPLGARASGLSHLLRYVYERATS